MTDNELIAKFLGWVPCECGTPKETHYKFGDKNWEVVTVSELEKFQTSWDELMPVIEKIESLGYDTGICRVVINKEELSEVLITPRTKSNGSIEIHSRSADSKLVATYKAVVEFIILTQ